MPINLIMEDIRKRDKDNLKREKEWKDEVSNAEVRMINAKVWINDYIKQNFNGERKIYRIIGINEI